MNSKILTIKENLFNAPKGSIIIHACNSNGAWGAGIAREFARRFPSAYKIYREECLSKGPSLLGSCLLIEAGDRTIGCLFTSSSYGGAVDKPAKILENTKKAVQDLLNQNTENKPMHMCKINSGLFAVPWNDTKNILKDFDREFTVYDY